MAAVGLHVSEKTFVQVTPDSPQMDALTEIFKRILEPLYGSQEKALRQIAEAKDRVCYLLYENKTPVGVLAFKTVLSDEFAEYGIQNSIEVKSLFVVDSSQNSGRGVGTTLFNQLIEKVNQLALNHSALHVTVSETKRESLVFFLKKGFRIVHTWQGKYHANTLEHLLCRPNQVAARDALELRARSEYVKGAHWDDIHGLVLLADRTFISGSKDHSLYKWDREGHLIRAVREVEPREVDSRAWITAMGVLNDAYWMSAERSGRVCLWSTKGDYIKDLNLKLPRTKHVSKQENQTRVNCITPSLDPHKPGFFVGFPTQFVEYNAIEGRTVSASKVDQNDWVYCIHPLDSQRLLAVVGDTVQIWQNEAPSWQRTNTIVPPQKGKKRDFITSLAPLPSNQVVLGCFSGCLKTVDLERKEVTGELREHRGKVWAVKTLSPNTFASGGDDALVRLWDVRVDKPQHVLKSPGGAISALLRFDDNLLIAGSCPKNPTQTEGAALSFYDIRK